MESAKIGPVCLNHGKNRPAESHLPAIATGALKRYTVDCRPARQGRLGRSGNGAARQLTRECVDDGEANAY